MSNQPTSGTLVCPACGEVNSRDRANCWLCHGPLPPAEPGSPAPSQIADLGREHSTGGGMLALLVLVVLLVCIGAIVVAPGLGILLGIILAPILIRTAWVSHRPSESGQPPTPGQVVRSFFATCGIVLLVLIGAAIAGFVICCIAVSQMQFGK